MKANHPFLKILATAAVIMGTTSCTTTYDAYGRPVQMVDPALAVAGVAAAGIAGYAIAENNNNDKHYYHNNNYYRPAPYYRPGPYYRPRPYYGRPVYRHHRYYH